jgi:archaellum component FlaG (FlaF/FlaG flagellin family)
MQRTKVAQSPTNSVAQTQAAGEYIIVDLTVKNVGGTPVQYYTDSQSLVIDGKQHPADILAAVYLSPGSADFIQPGLAIDVETPFDVPVGSVPESILLGDITEPSSVTVSLVGAPITSS